jgi:hypothetical protein
VALSASFEHIVHGRGLLDERAQVLRQQVRVTHRRREIRVPDCFLHVHGVLTDPEPGGDAAVSQIVRPKAGRQLRRTRRVIETQFAGYESARPLSRRTASPCSASARQTRR